MHNGVPLLALPVMAEQPANARRIEKLGIGLRLDFETFSKEDFLANILEVVENPK